MKIAKHTSIKIAPVTSQQEYDLFIMSFLKSHSRTYKKHLKKQRPFVLTLYSHKK